MYVVYVYTYVLFIGIARPVGSGACPPIAIIRTIDFAVYQLDLSGQLVLNALY